MGLTIRTRVGRKNTIYIPKAIAEAVELREGDIVTISVKDSKIVIEVIQDPFDLALRGLKFAETTFEEFERDSEEMQSGLFNE